MANRVRLSRPRSGGIGKVPSRNLRLIVEGEHRNTRASSLIVSTSGSASRLGRVSFVMTTAYRPHAARPPASGRTAPHTDASFVTLHALMVGSGKAPTQPICLRRRDQPAHACERDRRRRRAAGTRLPVQGFTRSVRQDERLLPHCRSGGPLRIRPAIAGDSREPAPVLYARLKCGRGSRWVTCNRLVRDSGAIDGSYRHAGQRHAGRHD